MVVWFDLFGDPVDVAGDEVVDVDGEGLAVAHAAAAHEVGDEEEPVVAGGAYVAELGGRGDDRALGVVLRGLDPQDGVLGVDAEAVRVQEDGLHLVEGVGLGGQAGAVAFHGADEAVDDLVVEGAHPAAAERREDVVLEQGLQGAERGLGEVALAGLPLRGALAELHRAVLLDAVGLALVPGSCLLLPVDGREAGDRLLLRGEAGLFGLLPGRTAVADLVLVRALRPAGRGVLAVLVEGAHAVGE
ncbi:hypothetical protein [Streptomyces erythrochromogenes]|uniref:hypothetical protein n=1 Tax=Streptomyces erythrochromogenes TaxID=285574 RepID=UPI0037D66959